MWKNGHYKLISNDVVTIILESLISKAVFKTLHYIPMFLCICRFYMILFLYFVGSLKFDRNSSH